jgi:hypothetical protein
MAVFEERLGRPCGRMEDADRQLLEGNGAFSGWSQSALETQCRCHDSSLGEMTTQRH